MAAKMAMKTMKVAGTALNWVDQMVVNWAKRKVASKDGSMAADWEDQMVDWTAANWAERTVVMMDCSMADSKVVKMVLQMVDWMAANSVG